MLTNILSSPPPSPDEYNSMRASVGWSRLDREATILSLKSTLYMGFVRDSRDELVAFARVIGDGYIYTYFVDVMVHPQHQRQGIGSRLMLDLGKKVDSRLTPGGFCGLLAVNGTETFYERFGFKPQGATNTAMGFYTPLISQRGDHESII